MQALNMSNMGDIFTSLREWSPAVNYYTESIEILQKIFPEDHGQLTNTINSL